MLCAALAMTGIGLLAPFLAVQAANGLPASARSEPMAGAPAHAYDCLIEPLIVSEVGSATNGVVSRQLVQRGAIVKRGQPLLQLESSIEQAVLEQAEARAAMQSEIRTREADLALAKLDYQRFADLHHQKLVPAQQYEEAVAREAVARAALVQAKENTRLNQLEMLRSRRALAQRTIRSPVDGVVVKRQVSVGELVYDNPVMTVARLDMLRVEVVLPARLYGTVRGDDTGLIYPEIGNGRPLQANVDIVDGLLDANSGTFGVSLLLANADLAVPAGQKCRVAFEPADEGARHDAVLGAANGPRQGDPERR